MARELRLAFAMGGGVSLGTFSGAALAEVLKLAVLRGGYRDEGGTWQRYDRVVVDVFSGASAGAMALGVMLRGLAHQTTAQKDAARQRLLDEFGDAFEALTDAQQADMIAAQVVQDVQAKVWGEDITIDRLLGERPDGSRRDLRYAAGILDRTAVEAIARDVISFGGQANLKERRLLADRVLFAATLSNISPILLDARKDLGAMETAMIGLADGLTSHSHKELRVFDLNFERVLKADTQKEERYPSRWCRYHRAQELAGYIGDLRKDKTWAKIAATAIACGAFPYAFDPVVLSRSFYEYGALLPDDVRGEEPDTPVTFEEKGTWPQELVAAGALEHPFTFVDGGTFNNEPIREAYRLSAFADAQQVGTPYDRRVIFVDPNVKPPVASLRVPVHQQYALQEPNVFGALDGVDLIRRTSLDRLAPHTGSLLMAILNEARVIEGDKVFKALDRFARRDQMRDVLRQMLTPTPTNDQLTEVQTFCDQVLEENTGRVALPAGALTVPKELERVIAEEDDLAPLAGQAEAFCARDEDADVEHAALWLRALAFVALDLMMDLEGKRPSSQLIAIAPVENVGDPDARRLIPLPGGLLKGFGGFMSPRPGRYEMALARHVTRDFLEDCGLITPLDDPPPLPTFSKADAALYKAHLKTGLEQLADRVGAMIRQTQIVNAAPGVDQTVLHLVAGLIEGKLRHLSAEPVPTTRFEVRLTVPDKRYELDGKGLPDRDLRALHLDGDADWHLIAFFDYDAAGDRWTGIYLDDDAQTVPISRDGVGPLPDRTFCTLAAPTAEQVEQARRYPHPIFTATITKDDEGEDLPPDRWHIAPGATPLEDTLFA